jgi:uncharacterized surface protein with fasciclin (FAS1) repeats
MKRTALLATLTALALLQGCASSPAARSVADVAAATPQLSTLNRLISDAGLTQTLGGPGPYTVFAPSDEAFKSVPPKTMAALAADKELLKAVLNYHVVPGTLRSDDVKPGSAKTAQGANLALSRAGSFVTVEDAMVTQADVPASNGVVHVIDRVLMPPRK